MFWGLNETLMLPFEKLGCLLLKSPNQDCISLCLHSTPGHLLWGKGCSSQSGAGGHTAKEGAHKGVGHPLHWFQRHYPPSKIPEGRSVPWLFCCDPYGWIRTSELLYLFMTMQITCFVGIGDWWVQTWLSPEPLPIPVEPSNFSFQSRPILL